MPKRIAPLSDIQVSKAKPKDSDYKLNDGFGLYLLVTPTGGKLWRFKYRFANKPKLLSFGSYPEISIAAARRKREEARSLIANGVDPGEVRKAQKAAGIILGYTVVTNQTTDSPDDWSVAFALTYANWAALDSVGARTDPITLRHYGTAQARTAVGNGRAAIRTLVRSNLMRVQNVSRSQRP